MSFASGAFAITETMPAWRERLLSYISLLPMA
jgi:hypothetical protein